MRAVTVCVYAISLTDDLAESMCFADLHANACVKAFTIQWNCVL